MTTPVNTGSPLPTGKPQPYTLSFSVPARIAMRVTVNCENHQDALADGYAALAEQVPQTAEVLSVDLEDAKFLDLERTPAHPAPAAVRPAPALDGCWQVGLYLQGHLLELSAPLREVEATARQEAALAEQQSLFDEVALQQFGAPPAIRTRTKRGGWEVWAQAPDDQSPKLLSAWLDEPGAKQLLQNAVLSKTYQLVRLVDYSDRVRGPHTKGEVRSTRATRPAT